MNSCTSCLQLCLLHTHSSAFRLALKMSTITDAWRPGVFDLASLTGTCDPHRWPRDLFSPNWLHWDSLFTSLLLSCFSNESHLLEKVYGYGVATLLNLARFTKAIKALCRLHKSHVFYFTALCSVKKLIKTPPILCPFIKSPPFYIMLSLTKY